MTRISVLIATHNRAAFLSEALAALRRQQYDPAKFEIVVAPDRCTDDTLALLSAASDVKVARVPASGGKAAALNAAISVATGDLGVFIDDDVLPDPRFLAEHEAAHATSSTARIAVTGCSPVVISEDTSAIARETARRYERFHNRLSDPHRVDAPTDLNGANFSIRLGDIREIGGFNEEYFFQRDDFELGTRLIEAGFRILFAARATAPQRVKDDPNQIINRAKPRALNDLRLAREHPWCVRYLPFGAAMTNDTSRRKWFVLWNSGSVGRAAIKAAHVLFPSSTRLLNLRYAAEYVAVLKESLRSWRAMDDFRAQAQSGLER